MYFVLSSILPIFLTIFMGKMIKWQWISSVEFWRGLERLSYYLLFPVVLFNYISTADLESKNLNELLYGIVITTILVSVGLIFAQMKFAFDKKIFTSIFQGSVRYNSYIFFGLADALYGSEGIQIVSVISAYMIIFTNIITVLIFSIYIYQEEIFDENHNTNILYNKSKWKILLKNLALNPLIIASFLGFIVNYSDISPGLIFRKFLDSISDSAFTIGLLCVGSSLKLNINLKDSKIILITSSIKLLIMPILGYVIFLMIGIESLLLSVGILYLSLPTASNSYILSKQMGGDPESMATILTFTIIFSIFTISILTVILS